MPLFNKFKKCILKLISKLFKTSKDKEENMWGLFDQIMVSNFLNNTHLTNLQRVHLNGIKRISNTDISRQYELEFQNYNIELKIEYQNTNLSFDIVQLLPFPFNVNQLKGIANSLCEIEKIYNNHLLHAYIIIQCKGRISYFNKNGV